LKRITSRPLALPVCALVLLSSACSGPNKSSVTTDSAQRAAAVDSTARPIVEANKSPWSITETGYGPLRAGMTLAEARTALGTSRVLAAPRDPQCDHVTLDGKSGAESGLLLMIVEGRVARVELRDSSAATAAGARIGDSETRVKALYPGRVRVLPHKYTDGHYLIVPRGSGADSLYRLVFETDATGRVTLLRGGHYPEVEWVEGCA
jgi:hypothetical protein